MGEDRLDRSRAAFPEGRSGRAFVSSQSINPARNRAGVSMIIVVMLLTAAGCGQPPARSSSSTTLKSEVLPSGTAPLTGPEARPSMGAMDVSSLGYLRITAEDPHNWAGFAAHVLGMEVVPGDGDVLHLRMDDRHHRIAIEPVDPTRNGAADGSATAGRWPTPPPSTPPAGSWRRPGWS